MLHCCVQPIPRSYDCYTLTHFIDVCDLAVNSDCVFLRPNVQQREALRSLFDKYIQASVDWVLEGVDGDDLVKKPLQIIPVTSLNMVTQCCNLLDAALSEEDALRDPAVRN